VEGQDEIGKFKAHTQLKVMLAIVMDKVAGVRLKISITLRLQVVTIPTMAPIIVANGQLHPICVPVIHGHRLIFLAQMPLHLCFTTTGIMAEPHTLRMVSINKVGAIRGLTHQALYMISSGLY
jgi:hypothetical protein